MRHSMVLEDANAQRGAPVMSRLAVARMWLRLATFVFMLATIVLTFATQYSQFRASVMAVFAGALVTLCTFYWSMRLFLWMRS
jgi:hypothetical protein